MTGIVIPARFNGPPDSANGGIAAGRLAALLGSDGPVQITLRMPPPLETEIRAETVDGVLRAFAGEQLVAEAQESTADIEAVPAIDFERAAEAATRFAGFADHPFPTCVGCGTDRSDGLACYAGPIDPAVPSAVATPFVARADLPRDLSLTWAALDCAGGWSIELAGRRAVLGRITGLVTEVPEIGERCVVVAACDRREGRKSFSRSTGYGEDGRVLGMTAATWIELR